MTTRREPGRLVEMPGSSESARVRRERALAMSPEERLAVVEEMIRLAIAAGTFQPKRPRPIPAKARPAL
jgi:hypothetical protein